MSPELHLAKKTGVRQVQKRKCRDRCPKLCRRYQGKEAATQSRKSEVEVKASREPGNQTASYIIH